MLRVFSVVVLCSLALVSSTFSQKRTCKLGNSEFACPRGLRRIAIDPPGNHQLFLGKDFALFAAVPVSQDNDPTFVGELTKVALAKLFPTQSQNFVWKQLKYGEPVSKFEVRGGTSLGFNGAIGVVVKYRHVKVSAKELLVGYVAQLGRGADAKEVFDRGLGADSVASLDGCSASVEVIYSITGEKVNENNSPCSLDVGRIDFTQLAPLLQLPTNDRAPAP
jgi:hypothetical protein